MATITFPFLIFIVGIFAKQAAADQGEMVNPVVLLTGGYSETGLSDETDSVEVFSLDESCSKYLPDIPDPRIQHTTQYFKGEVVMCGGRYTRQSCLKLDENNTFVNHSQLPLEFDSDIAIVHGDKFLLSVYGGQQSWNGSQWIVQTNPLSDLMKEVYISCTAVTKEGTVIITTQNEITRAQKVFKLKDGILEEIASYPGPTRIGEGCAVIQTQEGEKFLIAGGYSMSCWSCPDILSSYLYNIEEDHWDEVGNIAAKRMEGQIMVLDGKVILLGGQRDVEEFNVKTKTWRTIEQKIKQKRILYNAVVIPGSLVGC